MLSWASPLGKTISAFHPGGFGTVSTLFLEESHTKREATRGWGGRVSEALRIVAAAMPDHGEMFYLADSNDDFISKVYELFCEKCECKLRNVDSNHLKAGFPATGELY